MCYPFLSEHITSTGKVDHNRFTCPGQWNMQVAELQEVVIRLYNIREAEKELNSCFQVQSAGNPKPAAKQLKTSPNSTHTAGRGASNT